MERQVYADKEYDELIKPVMIAAKFVSFWPLERDHSTSAEVFKTCHVIWFFFVLISMCISVTADIVNNFNDLDELTACALMDSALYLATLRLIIYTTSQKDMLYVVEIMRKDWTCSSYEDRVVLKEKCLFAFRLAKCFIIMVIVTVTTFSCIPILEVYVFGKEKIFPFRGYFFVNQSVTPVYECIYVFNVMGGFFAGGTIIGATSFNFVAITHGSAKFAVLRKRLETMNSNDPNADRAMANCIKDHQNAITFADALERIINILALGQFVISTGLVCFAGFQITSMLKNKARLMKYSMFLNSAILELFMFSFSGHALIDEAIHSSLSSQSPVINLRPTLVTNQSDAVSKSAYCSYWIGGTFGRSLQIVMMRSKVPSRITAAKFYSMSLESFSQVLSTSFSYIMVLMTTSEESPILTSLSTQLQQALKSFNSHIYKFFVLYKLDVASCPKSFLPNPNRIYHLAFYGTPCTHNSWCSLFRTDVVGTRNRITSRQNGIVSSTEALTKLARSFTRSLLVG
ncbi:PREDICTED: LOW QUALITY PROTEIN: odorant receptor 13a-like [Trachymyrmex septentrionalis]|uniref:LOW QUALITY PROTEIN: odorant receptor 13a-like n=1 Tax=Trachymyrmex septentrionalis TaxID=34720 RepID=UPI00084F0548|nr:PREDICTED: LOW QUALITY PROTEIN: odorant receptor 13a-like [Trachymyrmex septentrionalis]